MTQEEKAKHYDEALERASKLRFQNPFDTVSQMVEHVFPELKESEDERIRKWIIDDIIYNMDNEPLNNSEYKKEAEKAISWLEKQGQEKHLSEPIKDYQGSFTCWNNAHDFRPKHLQRCICYDKYMGGVYCYVYDDISKYWCTQTTEEHDSDGDNHISDYADYRITLWMPLPDTSFYPSKSWLEKLGQQDDYDDNIITRDDEILQAISIGLADAEKDLGWSDFGGLPIEEIQGWLEKQSKPKWTDEDEHHLRMCIECVEECAFQDREDFSKTTDWLKSLKYNWKPSEEHIHWLKWVVNKMPDTEKANEAEAVLEDLLEQLKKLKG